MPSICERVLDRIARDAGVSPAPRLTRDAMVQLSRYSFPGNVRELENLLHRAVALTVGDVIDVADLGVSELVFSDSEASEFEASPVVSAKPAAAAAAAEAVRAPVVPVQAPLPSDLAAYLDDIERDVLERALERYRYNRTAAGASLGLSLRQMRYRMARLGVNVGGTDDPVDVERGEPG
jgi:two-component system response regulator PilR (NtrC family)